MLYRPISCRGGDRMPNYIFNDEDNEPMYFDLIELPFTEMPDEGEEETDELDS